MPFYVHSHVVSGTPGVHVPGNHGSARQVVRGWAKNWEYMIPPHFARLECDAAAVSMPFPEAGRMFVFLCCVCLAPEPPG